MNMDIEITSWGGVNELYFTKVYAELNPSIGCMQNLCLIESMDSCGHFKPNYIEIHLRSSENESIEVERMNYFMWFP